MDTGTEIGTKYLDLTVQFLLLSFVGRSEIILLQWNTLVRITLGQRFLILISV